LATAPVPQPADGTGTALTSADPKKSAGTGKSRRRSTAHLKIVPETLELRERVRARAREVAKRMDPSRPPTKDEMESVARKLLEEQGLVEGYLGWTMVALATAYWQDQVAASPPSRRLFLLPHCLKHAEGCPADYDQFGLDCKRCGACSIADFRTVAEEMGYKVLVAEGSPIVMKIIVSGYVDAIVGVACLNVLEKAIDKILLAGIPCMAIPLLSSDCRNTSVDESWVHEMIHVQPAKVVPKTRTYLHLLRGASGLFSGEGFARLAPRARSADVQLPLNGQGLSGLEPLAATEAISFDFLTKGGKHSRPFITLAVYDALTGASATLPGGDAHIAAMPDAVKRAAMSIETFHKASLVHDDIEDDDFYRYGDETLHRKYGTPTAINVGDYLIGLGYRLVSRESAALGADVVADILDCLADAHLRLAEGQGAELAWRDSRDKQLKPIDALRIYALKTAPAFEAAFYAGARMATDARAYVEPMKQFARNLGVAFQILNDLKDWETDSDNKLSTGADVLGGRPTVLWALALEGLDEASRAELIELVEDTERPPEARIARVRQLYHEAGVFETAHRLVDKHQERAEAVADTIEPEELRRLMYYLVDTVLDRGSPAPPQLVTPETILSLPIAAAP